VPGSFFCPICRIPTVNESILMKPVLETYLVGTYLYCMYCFYEAVWSEFEMYLHLDRQLHVLSASTQYTTGAGVNWARQ